MNNNPIILLQNWIVNGAGKNIPAPTIAKALQISTANLKKALSQKVHFPELDEKILMYLKQQGVEDARLERTRADEIMNTPALFVKTPSLLLSQANKDDADHHKALTKRLLNNLNTDTVFCQIQDGNISTRNCLFRQNPTSCFGCDAESHLCRVCKLRPVMNGVFVDMCSICLQKELENESDAAAHGTPPIHPFKTVACNITKKPINQKTCRQTQSENCKHCTASSRLCSQCKKRSVYYPEFGLCLACTLTCWEVEVVSCRPFHQDEIDLLERIKVTEYRQPEKSTNKEDHTDTSKKHPNQRIDLTTLPDEFALHLATQKMRATTIRIYTNICKKWVHLMQEQELYIDEFNESYCREFVLQTEQGTPKSYTDAQLHRSTLRKLFTWLQVKFDIDGLPMVKVNLPPKESKPNTDTQDHPSPIKTDLATFITHNENPPEQLSDEQIIIGYNKAIRKARLHNNNALAQALQTALSKRTKK